jgi:hypothetical protein
MNARPMKMTIIALGIGATIFIGADNAQVSTSGSDAKPDGDQKTYELAAKQDTPESYLYVDLQSGEVIKTSMIWQCENADSEGIKKYVELPTGKILNWNCGK